MGTLTVVRPKKFAGRLKAYKIFVDGQSVGSIDAGQTVKLQLGNGSREVQARLAWGKSPVMRLEITSQSSHALEVGGNPKIADKKPWSRFFDLLLHPSDYLYLKHQPKNRQ